MTSKKGKDAEKKELKVHRSAKTGKFVSSSYAQAHPETTVYETIVKGPSTFRNKGGQVRNTGVPPKLPKPPKPRLTSTKDIKKK